MQNKKAKLLLELADNIEKADDILVSLGYVDFASKKAFIEELFDFRIVHRKGESIEDDYKSLLNSVVNQKWRS